MTDKNTENRQDKSRHFVQTGKAWILLIIICVALVVVCVSLLRDIYHSNQPEDPVESEDEPVELDLTYAFQNPQWNLAIESVIEQFESEYPDIKINYEVSYENRVYEDILTKKVARDELGDIVQLKTPEAYAAAGLLGEISDEAASLVSSVYTYDGKVYGVGAVESTWGVLYNKDIFEKYDLSEPETYDDFLNICETLKEAGITPIGVGGSDLWHMEYWVNHFFHSDILSTDPDWLKDCSLGLVSWTDPEAEAMIDHLYGLFSEGYVNDDWLTTTDTSLAYRMSEEDVALIYTGPWTAAAIKEIDPDMELGWFYVPDESGKVYATDNLDTFWSITAGCAADEEKYEAAMTFLEYFYSDEAYTRVCETSCTFPLTGLHLDYVDDSFSVDVRESFENADGRVSIYIGNEDTPEDFERNMLQEVMEILAGTVPAKDGMADIQQIWEQGDDGVAS
ncbi:MAG: ABC transporter substrate-binding protein [Clostridiales bacterium]|nr:ABC transporter substrate-binding protein [Clostridiales bacterium]